MTLSRSTRSVPRPCATSLISRSSSRHLHALSRWIVTIDRPSRSSRRRMRSSIWPWNGIRRIYDPSVLQRSNRSWCQCVMRRIKHAMWSIARRNIPFVKYGGLKFLEAAHIKDVLAFLRWAENLRDRVSGFRVIQLLPGAGPATATRLLDRLAESDQPMEALLDFQPPKACAEGWPAFADALRVVRGGTAGWPAEFELVCRWYAPHLERLYEHDKTREVDLVQLAQIASTYPNRERFLTELILDPPTASSGEAGLPLLDEDYLILSTIHSAKGQ